MTELSHWGRFIILHDAAVSPAQQVQGKLAKENNTNALFSKHKHILLYIIVYLLQVLSVSEYICLSVLVQMQTLIWKSAVFPYVSHQVFVLSQLFGL